MELILSVCLVAAPATCREEIVALGQEQIVPSSQCLVGAPSLIAGWTESHPKWRVARWRCGPHADGKDI
ncbi:hypothetical protein MWN34_05020 [Ancylobacter sp. 6x-1]|uniref:Secreted protein n=1 Tax=Ancylobacter crimeensis TaxID=2579147 RepID=A0ABT0D8J5_9HYPH|nr:hypothetical protein [Ancylobacter crimeensis]MCK0196270.1 hypothetical protein [Ancylobacter crimeensis]